jgi:hypothetical protein
MKKLIILISITFFVKATFGQAYIVTYLKGDVYHDKKLIKLHDRVDGVSAITSGDKNAELALFSAQKGKFRVSFVNSKPVAADPAEKKSELYQVVVGNYLLKYTTEKALTTRGDFDLKSFFNSADTGRNKNAIFLLEGELLPLKSQAASLHPDDKFFICVIKGSDTICNPVRRKGAFLSFDEQTIKGLDKSENQIPQPVTCFIKHWYPFNGKYIEEHFSEPLSITFLPKRYLQDLAASFQEGTESYYQGNKTRLITDMEDQLGWYYGRNFEPAASQVLKSYLK